MLIYKAENIINGKCYIGKTVSKDFRKYKNNHLRNTEKNITPNRYFYRAVKKHGKKKFKWSVLWEGKCSKEFLNQLEKYYIYFYDSFENGYNMTTGGDGGFCWPKDRYKELQKLCKKMVEKRDNSYLKGENNWMNKIPREKMIKHVKKMVEKRDNSYLKGENNPFCKLSPEKRMEAVLKGNKKRRMFRHSKEARKRMSEIRKTMYKGRNNPQAKEWILYSPENIKYIVKDGLTNFCKEFNLSLEMLRKNVNNGKIRRTVKGKRTIKAENTTGWRVCRD